ncbi:serine hydrolase [Sphingomonas cannabina]|uniref:serine hydrolase n=1 Tax=Sphingomonas cannabina TaxID=2899123 RepID=UPI001F39E607|nr:serine hydrolase [Sphingomonas cannabina]UIJ44812.1 serine hydrolase [Sphingomonas cannabina]
MLKAIRLATRMAIFALLSASTPIATQTTPSLVSSQAAAIPDTPVGRKLRAYLEAFNSDEPERINEFFGEKSPPSGAPSANAGLRAATGGFDLVELQSATDNRIVAVLGERLWEGSYSQLTLEVDPLNGKIRAISLQPASAPANLPRIKRMTEGEALAALKAKLDRVAGSGDFAFSGAVRVSHNGRTVFDFVSGQADRENGIVNTSDSKFRIGSMNKMFTAVAILQLVDAGRISLNGTIGTYLRDYPNKELASQVTVRHLLTHTGGTGDIFGPEFDQHRLGLCEHSDYVALYGKRNAAFKPGERFAYSNFGYVLLGAIIEKVTGQSYFDYVRTHIYLPAGMTATGSLPETTHVPKRVVGYTTRGPTGPVKSGPNTDSLPCRGTSAGGGYSTVGDLIRFSEALRKNTLLNPRLLAEATRLQVAEGPYGYGFVERQVNGTRAFGHSGGAPGMAAELMVFPELGYAIAIAVNTDSQITTRIAQFVGARLPVAGGY